MTVLTPKLPKLRWSAHQRSHPVQPEPAKLDRFEYGWREVPRITDAGEVIYERQPLTLWDILHPQVGDFRVHTIEHEKFCGYLLDVFLAQVAHDPSAVVLHDTRVAWADREIIPHGPDIAVIFNVREKDNWATFDEMIENTRPTLIVEIISPKTRRVDVEDKKDEYAQAGVETYIIVDAKISRGRTRYSLIGYQLVDRRYQNIKPNERGWFWLECVNVWVGIHNNWLVCFDADGNPIGDYVQLTEQAKQATRIAKIAEKQADVEAQRAQAEAQRAEAEAQRADTEMQTRIQLERQLQIMQAELDRLRQQK